VTFKKAVEEAKSPLDQAYQPGLQALKAYSKKICCTRPVNKSITGSVDLDSALAKIKQYASENRWDYGVGYMPSKGRECAVWVEVHGAKDKEVGTLARKARWLKDYLKNHAPELWRLTLASPEGIRFVWLGTKDVHLSKHDPAYRRAAMEGITLHGTTLTLP
jgi:alanine-alpha-ketoisovalerate/valine-pyruvate aminotransferase